MRHTLVLLKGHLGNPIYGFGSGKRSQLGVSIDRIRKSYNLPQIVAGFEEVEIANIVANGDQSAALTVDGHVYSWGKGFCGKSDTHHPLESSVPMKFTQVALGWNHALALTDFGKLFIVGGKHHGMLSDPQKMSLKKCSSNQSSASKGSEDDSKAPKFREVPGLDATKVVDIAAGAEHSALVTENGRIMTWGWGEHGQLGLGNEEDRTTPQQVNLSAKLLNCHTRFNVYCGSGFTFAIGKGSLVSQT
ncbi:Ultraviolet-b receptor uvr8 [Thalictrum thalictroides]|uniref:Ultraviolet-b receptor uvr8 n=1 Tax=Thalictrum thalictroides TaxID=46969 RepID=A0A7J6VXG5_THATH|nr:Ultraviolet-b receptor uvr8 [Thalictrum thalictroides]